MLLLIDNYDSFVHNLARYCARLGQSTCVVRNDAATVAEVRRLRPVAIILSPGPCTPHEAGCSMEIVRQLHDSIPILGVCLGHQAIAAAFGGQIRRAREPMHGRASQVLHSGVGIFAGLPNPLIAGRYHSLVVEEDTLPAELSATAHAPDGTLMAFEHRQLPIYGVQFHPESILTEHGYELLANFLRCAGIDPISHPPKLSDELRLSVPQPAPLPTTPVTF